jgi:HTH-type transcriptional regulator/antitoxin HigA
MRLFGYSLAVNDSIQDYKTPGQLIQKLLDDRGWSQRILGVVLGVDQTGLNKIIAGNRPLDADMALTLSIVFDIPAEIFLQLQKNYDLALARLKSRPDPNLASRARLFGELPLADMVKRGWLDGVNDIRDVPQVEAALCKFFRVEAVDQIDVLPHAAKKSDETAPVTPTQLAWLYRVKEIASEMLVARYTVAGAQEAIAKLSDLRASAEEARKVPRILTECGIRFVVVESLKSAKIDGVCFWLDEKSPVIGMTLRYDRIDNFWFVLRHELEHVLRGHGKGAAMIDSELEGDKGGVGTDVPDEERVANQAAGEFCVPEKMMRLFISRKSPVFAERDLLGFAKTINVHPGLVAGQLQRRTERYDRWRNHLVKIRPIVTPTAVVDGWGDVAPVGL